MAKFIKIPVSEDSFQGDRLINASELVAVSSGASNTTMRFLFKGGSKVLMTLSATASETERTTLANSITDAQAEVLRKGYTEAAMDVNLELPTGNSIVSLEIE